MSRQIVILGAGISGLATAYYLKHYLGSNAIIKVIEKNGRAGGWIETIQDEGFLFEQGPRSCRSKGAGRETLALIETLGLQDQVIVPHTDAADRYLYEGKDLKRMPKHFWEIPFNPLMPGWLKALWQDWRSPKRAGEDESIHSFFSRRLGKEWADRLIDPFVLGIYAGDCRELSMKSCFPLFDEWERTRGSLLRGAWRHKRVQLFSSSFIDGICRFPLFSFKEGMETLPRALAHELGDSLLLNNGVSRLEFLPSGIGVHLENGECLVADHVISTLPSYALGPILPLDLKAASALQSLKYATVGIVNMGFNDSVLPVKGFGYLIPTKMKSLVLGCVWDSCIFPQQNERISQTRLTFMLGGGHHPEMEHMADQEIAEHALKALHQQMGIRSPPAIIQVKKAIKAIPQFAVEHERWKEGVYHHIQQLSPCLALSGNVWTGVSINDCIGQARRLAQRLEHSLTFPCDFTSRLS